MSFGPSLGAASSRFSVIRRITASALYQIFSDLSIHNDALFMSNKEKVDKFLVEICQLILAPPVGLEPTTCGLTVRRSTD